MTSNTALLSIGKQRRFIIDSGASYHLIGDDDLTQRERKTFKDLDSPIELQSANGLVTVTQTALIDVRPLDLRVRAHVLPEAQLLLSLGRLIRYNNLRCIWDKAAGVVLQETFGRRRKFICTSHNDVPYLANYVDNS